MILLTVNQTIEVVLGGAVATAQPHLYASFVDLDNGELSVPAPTTGLTNSTTPVTWVNDPVSGARQVKYLSLFNADTANVTVTVSINDNGTLRTLLVATLATGERLEYVDSVGFKA